MSSTVTKPFTEVQPSITASRATGYIPPGATGGVSSYHPSATTTARPHVPNPSTPAFINDFQWINSYLFIHKMSTPSYRYSFLLWIFLVLVVSVVAILHWTGSRGGPVGAAWSKWALRRRTWRKRHTLAKAKREGKPHQQPFSFPSNAQMLSLIILFLIPLALCFIGPDYIAPGTKLWDLTHNVTKRGLDHTFMHYDLLSRAAVASTATTRAPEYTIPKAWWTVGGRTGIIAFALFPLVVLFALKAPPFAVFAIPFLIQVHFDKLARLHRWTGRLIWLITTIHVVTWGIQLGRDKRGTGNRNHVDSPAWLFVWQYPLFIEGVIAYVALTALVVLSLDSFRVRYYEAFYVLHVILVPITLVFAALHFPTIWWWCWSALFLWIGERLHRAIRWAYVNGLMGKGKIPAGAAPPPMKFSAPGSVSEKKPSTPPSGGPNEWEQGVRLVRSQDSESSQMPLQYRPRVDSRTGSYDSYAAYPQETYSDWDSRVTPTRNSSYGLLGKEEFDARSRGSNGPSGSQADLLQNYPPQSPTTARHETQRLNPDNNSPRYPPTINSGNNQPHTRYSRIPPPGFALCQLLPGRVVRMRLLTPRPIVWAPGQHVLLQVPSVSKYTTHPFTITGCYDDESETGEGRVVELLVRAKNGFTKDLWEEVVRLVNQAEAANNPFAETEGEMENGFAVSTGPLHTREKSNMSLKKNPHEHTGVLLRAFVDGPFGSSIRAHWGSNSTVFIVVGGTGVSFGISILEYLCLCLSGRDGKSLGGRPGGWGARGFKTSRVRFIWLIREFSHIQWCATVLRRCMEMVPSSILQVDIFVSNTELITQPQPHGNNRNSMLSVMGPDDLAPPSAQFMGRNRANSNSSVDSLVSANSRPNSMIDLDYMQASPSSPYGDHYHSQELGHEAHVLDYTNFDGEDDTRVAGEAKISKRVQKEGKIRRAKSRRAAAAAQARTELESKSRQATGGSTFMPAIEVAGMSTDRSAGPPRPPRSGRTSPGPNSPPGLPQGAYSPASPHPPSSFDPKFSVSAADAYRNAGPDTFLSPSNDMSAQRRWSQQSMNVFRAPSPGFHASENNNRFSVASLGDLRAMSPAGGPESVHRFAPGERPISMAESMLEQAEVRLEIDDQELEDVHFVSEMARPGKPRLERMLADEVGRARGAVAVACCGPASLNALVRKMVATQINPQQVLQGEMQGMITLITEEFQW